MHGFALPSYNLPLHIFPPLHLHSHSLSTALLAENYKLPSGTTWFLSLDEMCASAPLGSDLLLDTLAMGILPLYSCEREREN